MDFLYDLGKKINLVFCAEHRQILIHKLNKDLPINLGELIESITDCEICKRENIHNLEIVKKEITPFKLGSIISTLFSHKSKG